MCLTLKLFLISHFNYIASLLYLLYNFFIGFYLGSYFLADNLELEFILSNNLQMNNNSSINPFISSENATNLEDPNKDWIDLRLVKFKNNYYLVDSTDESGNKLLNKLQTENSLSKIRYIGCKHNGVKLDVEGETKLNNINLERIAYKGLFLDLNLKDATVTSHNLPIQKNDSGKFFVIWKKTSVHRSV